MSIVVESCPICVHPRVVAINNDMIKGFSFNKICERNGLEFTSLLAKNLLKHRRSHMETPSMALARQMLHEEAVSLKNTAVEVNLALDQMDLMALSIWEEMELAETIDQKHKLYKNYSDILKRKFEFLGLLNKMNGNDLQEELKRASLTEVIKRVSRAVGDKKISELKKNVKKVDKIESFFMQDPHINALYNELSSGDTKNETKNKE